MRGATIAGLLMATAQCWMLLVSVVPTVHGDQRALSSHESVSVGMGQMPEGLERRPPVEEVWLESDDHDNVTGSPPSPLSQRHPKKVRDPFEPASASAATTTSTHYRPVYMNMYEKPMHYQWRHVFPPHPIIHTEVEVGGREFGVFLSRNGGSNIRIRPDPAKSLLWRTGTGFFVGYRFLCYTQKTDAEVEALLPRYTGTYNAIYHNCNNFVDFMKKNLCGGAPLQRDYYTGDKYLRTFPFIKYWYGRGKRDPDHPYRIKYFQPQEEFTKPKSRRMKE